MREEIISYLNKTQTVHLATCSLSQPRIRPVTLIYFNSRFFFATNSRDKKTQEIAVNPRVELCLIVKDDKGNNGTIRAAGSLVQIDDVELKKEVADWSEFIYDYWDDPADETYRLYEVIVKQVEYMRPSEMTASTIDW